MKSGRVAVVKVALRQRESLAILRVAGGVIVLTTCLWPDEVRTPDFPFLAQEPPEPPAQEEAVAEQLVDMLSEYEFKPEKYTDAYPEAPEDVDHLSSEPTSKRGHLREELRKELVVARPDRGQ